jgi:hypothetical protein
MLLRSTPFLITLLVLSLLSLVVVVRVRVTMAPWPQKFLWIAAVSTLSFFPCVFLHNAVSSLLRIEEPVFFILAIIVSPLGLLGGLVGAVVSTILRRP